MQFLSVYLHIPFCRVRCSYCAFNIYVDQQHLIDRYLAALEQEIQLLAHGEAVHTIYWGGGTPSLLSADQVGHLQAILAGSFKFTPEAEITFEVNPQTIDAVGLAKLRAVGINRLSIGMQSAIADELTLYERDHTLEDTLNLVQIAHKQGFQNISLDLIYGSPHQTLGEWETTLDVALSLSPAHFSLYSLQLESGTKLTRQVKYGQLPAPDEDLAADMYELADEKLSAAGFEQYELSSWSRAGYESRHNLQYWQNLPYLGLGAGAHGYLDGVRTVNVMRPEIYIQRLKDASKNLPYPRTGATQTADIVTREQAIFETIMLGLRLVKNGLSLPMMEQRFGFSFMERYGSIVARLTEQGLLSQENQHLYLTKRARLLANRVISEFIWEEEKSS